MLLLAAGIVSGGWWTHDWLQMLGQTTKGTKAQPSTTDPALSNLLGVFVHSLSQGIGLVRI